MSYFRRPKTKQENTRNEGDAHDKIPVDFRNRDLPDSYDDIGKNKKKYKKTLRDKRR